MRPAHIKEQRKKQARKIWKELDKLYEEKWNLPLIKLEKPIRHGWYKEIILTEYLDRYKIKPEILEIFKILDKYYWGRTKEYCEKKWVHQTSRHFIYKDVPTISKKQYNRLSDKAKKLCTPFLYRDYKKYRMRFYIRMPKNAYRIKFTRAHNTHVQAIDTELEQRISFLDDQFMKPGLLEERAKIWKSFRDFKIDEVQLSRTKMKQHLARHRYTDINNLEEELWEIN